MGSYKEFYNKSSVLGRDKICDYRNFIIDKLEDRPEGVYIRASRAKIWSGEPVGLNIYEGTFPDLLIHQAYLNVQNLDTEDVKWGQNVRYLLATAIMFGKNRVEKYKSTDEVKTFKKKKTENKKEDL